MKSNIAVLCGWTTREKTIRELQAADQYILAKVAAIGNLYSAERGIDMVLRNILAHPFINTIIFTGKDITGAAEPFQDIIRDTDTGFMTDEAAKYWFWRDSNLMIGGDIPEDVLLECRKSLFFLEESHIDLVPALVDKVFEPGKKVREPRLYPPPRPDAETLPAPHSIHPIRVDTIAEGYLELLYQIMAFGHTIDTHYDQASKELMNLTVVIENEPPSIQDENLTPMPSKPLPEYIPFDEEHLRTYVFSLIAGKKDDNVSYKYGHLMRHHFGVDQMIRTAMKLGKEPDSRSAVISLWDPHIEKSSPCLNHIWFRIVDEKLYMTCVIRSNDMLYGWPENAYGMRALQEWMRTMVIKFGPEHGCFMDDKHLMLGDLTIVSQSAHIYEDGWQPAMDIVDKYRKPRLRFDPKGNFVFNHIAMDRIKAQLIAPSGEVVLEFEGKTANEIRKKIDTARLISDPGHALWVGQELGKMEAAAYEAKYAAFGKTRLAPIRNIEGRCNRCNAIMPPGREVCLECREFDE